MQIRDVLPADAADVRRVVAVAFGEGRGDHGDEVADLWDDVVAAGHARASLVAVEDGEVVGHVGVSHSWVDARRELVDILVLSPLSVVPERQRSGIGTALVAAAVEAARALGAPALFLEGSPAYYGARGFLPGRARTASCRPATGRPARRSRWSLYDGHEDWMTGRLVYRDVWWQHDSAGLRDPDLAELEERFG